MTEEFLKSLCEKGLSTRQIGNLLNLKQTSVRYWLKKFSLKTVRIPFKEKSFKCGVCGETNSHNFYGTKKDTCSNCHNKVTISRARANKKFAIAHLGGKCSRCGYFKCDAALDFHHLDPTVKDKNFTTMKSWGRVRILKELSKCILLCSNCHREEHATVKENIPT